MLPHEDPRTAPDARHSKCRRPDSARTAGFKLDLGSRELELEQCGQTDPPFPVPWLKRSSARKPMGAGCSAQGAGAVRDGRAGPRAALRSPSPHGVCDWHHQQCGGGQTGLRRRVSLGRTPTGRAVTAVRHGARSPQERAGPESRSVPSDRYRLLPEVLVQQLLQLLDLLGQLLELRLLLGWNGTERGAGSPGLHPPGPQPHSPAPPSSAAPTEARPRPSLAPGRAPAPLVPGTERCFDFLRDFPTYSSFSSLVSASWWAVFNCCILSIEDFCKAIPVTSR